MSEKIDVELTGCRAEPLAGYLKALGVLRLVAEQKDSAALGYWRGDCFVLRSILDRDSLVAFFESEWRPTPIVAPWNGGSGFTGAEGAEDDSDEEGDVGEETESTEEEADSPLGWVRQSNDSRLAEVRSVVDAIFAWPDLPPTDLLLCEALAEARGKLADEAFARGKKGKEISALVGKIAPFEQAYAKLPISEVPRTSGAAKLLTKIKGWRRAAAKSSYIERTRSTLPDSVVAWMDSVVAPGREQEKVVFSSLLGSGANDGRLDFTKTTFARLRDAFTSSGLARAALFDESTVSASKGSLGMFSPSLADSTAQTNPWDWLLAMEGALMFAGAATKRLGSSVRQGGSFPFQVARMTTESLVANEDGRDELWLPLWTQPASHRELRRFFAEGRARVGERDATTGLDFARAVSTLGVSRGVDGFIRVAMTARNGKAHYATSEGRYAVADITQARLLDEIDGWFRRLRSASQDKRCPTRVSRAARALEHAFFSVTRATNAFDALLCLGDAERALGESLTFAKKSGLSPVTRCLTTGWSSLVVETVESRLGVCLGQRVGFRRRLLPINTTKEHEWGNAGDPGVVFTARSLVDNLQELLQRDAIESEQRPLPHPDDNIRSACRLSDIAAFIAGDVDDEAIDRWARAASLLRHPSTFQDDLDSTCLPAAFAVLRIAHSGLLGSSSSPKRSAALLSRASLGDCVGATTLAQQWLSARGRPLPVRALVESSYRTRRIAAALAFPLTQQQRRVLENLVLPLPEVPVSQSPKLQTHQENS